MVGKRIDGLDTVTFTPYELILAGTFVSGVGLFFLCTISDELFELPLAAVLDIPGVITVFSCTLMGCLYNKTNTNEIPLYFSFSLMRRFCMGVRRKG